MIKYRKDFRKMEQQEEMDVEKVIDFALLGKHDEFELYDAMNWDEKVLFLNAWTPPRHEMTEEEWQAINDQTINNPVRKRKMKDTAFDTYYELGLLPYEYLEKKPGFHIDEDFEKEILTKEQQQAREMTPVWADYLLLSYFLDLDLEDEIITERQHSLALKFLDNALDSYTDGNYELKVAPRRVINCVEFIDKNIVPGDFMTSRKRLISAKQG